MPAPASPLGPCLPHFDAALCARLTPYLDAVSFPAGAVVVREGARDADMYFVISGDGRIDRGDLELMRIGPGDHFGELGLLASRARGASVIATSELSLQRLSIDRYRALVREQPDVAIALVHALVDGLGDRLMEMTERVGVLLRERSLPRRTSVEIRIDGETPVSYTHLTLPTSDLV